MRWAKRAAVAAGLVVLTYLIGLAALGLLVRPATSDMAVVLGSRVEADGVPSDRLRARLDSAVEVFRAGLAPVVVVSGGIDPAGHDEAAVMAGYLQAHGVPAAAIVQDPTGANTMATARTMARLMPRGGRVLVVTQWFHIPRTMLALREAGFSRVSGVWPRFTDIRDIYSFLREAVGVAAYAVGVR